MRRAMPLIWAVLTVVLIVLIAVWGGRATPKPSPDADVPLAADAPAPTGATQTPPPAPRQVQNQVPDPLPLPDAEVGVIVEALDALPGTHTVSCTLGQAVSVPRAVQNTGGKAPFLSSSGTVLMVRVDRPKGGFELIDYLEPIGDIVWNGDECSFVPVEMTTLTGTYTSASGKPLSGRAIKGCTPEGWATTNVDGRFELPRPANRDCTIAALSNIDEPELAFAKAIVPAGQDTVSLVYGGQPWTRSRQAVMAAQLASIIEPKIVGDGDRVDAAFDLALSKAKGPEHRAHLRALYGQFEAIQAIRQAQLDALSGGGDAAIVALREALAEEY